eukprot:3793093-Pyramimonas_sp.AAC.1
MVRVRRTERATKESMHADKLESFYAYKLGSMHTDNLKSSYAHTACVAGPKTSPSSQEPRMMSPMIVKVETHTHNPSKQ